MMSLDAVRQFNAEVLRLVATEIPLDTGFECGRTQLANKLEEIVSRWKASASDERDVASIVSNDPHLPSRYRQALLVWLQADGSPAALDLLTTRAVQRSKNRHSFSLARLQLLILGTLAFAAFIYICRSTIPKIELLVEQTEHPTILSLRIMKAFGATSAYWGIAVPIVVVFVLLRKFWRSKDSVFSDSWRAGHPIDCRSAVAEQIRDLLQQGVSMAEVRQRISPDIPQANPLLNWVLQESGERQAERAAGIAREVYTVLDQRRVVGYRRVVMGFLGLGVCGAVVLGLGLSVFRPLSDMLIELAKPK